MRTQTRAHLTVSPPALFDYFHFDLVVDPEDHQDDCEGSAQDWVGAVHVCVGTVHVCVGAVHVGVEAVQLCHSWALRSCQSCVCVEDCHPCCQGS